MTMFVLAGSLLTVPVVYFSARWLRRHRRYIRRLETDVLTLRTVNRDLGESHQRLTSACRDLRASLAKVVNLIDPPGSRRP